MHRYSFSTRLPTDGSGNGIAGPGSTKKPIFESTPTQNPEPHVTTTKRVVEHVGSQVLVTEYKYTVEKKVEPSTAALGRPRFSVIPQNRHTAPTILDPVGKEGSGIDKPGRSSSPIHDPAHGSAAKVEPVKDCQVINEKGQKPSSPVGDINHSSQARAAPVKENGAVHKRWDGPLATARDPKYTSPLKPDPPKNSGCTDDKLAGPSSPVLDHGQSTQPKVAPVKYNGAVDKKWDKPLATARDHTYNHPLKQDPPKSSGFVDNKRVGPSSPDRDQRYASPTKLEPATKNNVIKEKWDKPSTPVHDDKNEINKYGATDDKFGKAASPIHARPEKAEEFTTKVHAESTGPMRPGILCGKNWRDIPKKSNLGSAAGYGEYPNQSKTDLDKPTIGTIRNGQSPEPYVTKNGSERPVPKEWTMPPDQVRSRFGPSNSIGEAAEISKGAVNSAPPPQYNISHPEPRGLKIGKYTGIIDSREAQRRYGNIDRPARPFRETYRETIDSREAARKYGGAPL